MTRPIPKATTLVTDDGVAIDAVHLVGDDDVAIVLAHGFTLYWQHGAVWNAAKRLNRSSGVITFDFRGHGRSGGQSTLGDREIRDVDIALRYARELGYRRVATVGFSMGASIVLRHAALIGGADAVVSVSGPGWWYFRGTRPMRKVHWAVLIVHGDRDAYFPVDHAERLYAAAHEPKDLWIVPGFGHAESGAEAIPRLLDRIGVWIREVTPVAASPNVVA
jgi:pimeloyl-ACP methyl ester carboxylesterase